MDQVPRSRFPFPSFTRHDRPLVLELANRRYRRVLVISIGTHVLVREADVATQLRSGAIPKSYRRLPAR
jgi:hypothetical protein